MSNATNARAEAAKKANDIVNEWINGTPHAAASLTPSEFMLLEEAIEKALIAAASVRPGHVRTEDGVATEVHADLRFAAKILHQCRQTFVSMGEPDRFATSLKNIDRAVHAIRTTARLLVPLLGEPDNDALAARGGKGGE